jgi:sulfate transport system permease protein
VTFGFTLTYLCLLVLIPLAALMVRSAGLGWTEFWSLAADPRTVAALRLSFGAAIIAALINAVFGLLLAWVLVRYRFSGRRLIDAAIDLPFACRRRWPALRSPRFMRRTAGSDSFLRRLGSRSPTRRLA